MNEKELRELCKDLSQEVTLEILISFWKNATNYRERLDKIKKISAE